MTQGQRDLLAILERTKAVYLAKRCHVTKNAVYNWRAGRNGPGPTARKVLRAVYNVKWYEKH